MRRVRFSAAMSLDGYIAGPNGEFDWIPMDPEIDFAAMFKDFDTILMGRKSYEAAKAQENVGMPGMAAVVFSSTLRQEDCPGVTVARAPAETVRALRAAPGKDLWLFGGGELLRSFLALGLVDQLEIATIPILLGGGLPVLPAPAARASLTLVSHRVYSTTGTAFATYTVSRDGASIS